MGLIPKLMRLLKEIRWGLVARFTWVYVGVGILLLGLGTLLVEPTGFVAFRELLPFMILLSFPAGVAAFLVAWPFVDVAPGIDFFLLWLVAFLAGYIQWFHVVPNLRSGGLISLSLNQRAQTQPVVADEPIRIKQPVQPKPKIRRVREPRVLHFDEAGRTPLERAIHFTPQKRATRTR